MNEHVFRMDEGKILSYKQELDLRTATLHRRVTWLSPSGNTLHFEFERFASLADEHLLAVRCRITSVDYSGPLEIRAGLNGHVENNGWTHWNWQEQGKRRNICYLCCKPETKNLCAKL
jgi:kojibiose phosphorylase